MPEKFGNLSTSFDDACPLVSKLLIPLGSAVVPEAVEGDRAGGLVGVNAVAVEVDEDLKRFDGAVSGFAIGDKELVAGWGLLQMKLQALEDEVRRNGNCPHQTALAFNGEGFSFERFADGRRIQTETLVDAQRQEAGEIEKGDVVLTSGLYGVGQHTIEFGFAPCAVNLAETPSLQLQLGILRELMPRVWHLVVEEADGREVGFDGAGGSVVILQVGDIGE